MKTIIIQIKYFILNLVFKLRHRLLLFRTKLESGFHVAIYILSFTILFAWFITGIELPTKSGTDPDALIERVKFICEVIRLCIEILLVAVSLMFLFSKLLLWLIEPSGSIWKRFLLFVNDKSHRTNICNNAEGASFEASESNIIEIAKIASNLHGENVNQQNQRLFQYKRWFKVNSDIFSVLTHENKIIGYLSIIPLKNRNHLEEQLSYYQLSPSELCQSNYSARYIFIDALYIKPEFIKPKYNNLIDSLVFKFFSRISQFAAKEEQVYIYSFVYQRKRHKLFSKFGFGYYDKGHSNKRRILAFINTSKDYSSNDVQFSSITDYNLSRLESFTEIICEFSNKFENIKRFENYNSLGQIFEDNVSMLSDKNPLIQQLLGKNFEFYTHNVYYNETENQKLVKHFLSLSILEFEAKIKDKYLPCSFYTSSYKNKMQYLYKGIATFGKRGLDYGKSKNYDFVQDMLIILYPEQMRSFQSEQWQPYLNEGVKTPIIISGRILKDSQQAKITLDSKNEGVIALNITNFSYSNGTTTSKIGMLRIFESKSPIPNTIDSIFLDIDPSTITDDMDTIDIIKLCLMRSTKVMIKPFLRKEGLIQNVDQIKLFMKENYGNLTMGISDTFELFYYKNGSSNYKVGRIELKFYPNGIAKINRVKNVGRDTTVESYFGEINVRYNRNGKKFVYLKFIAMEPDMIKPPVTTNPSLETVAYQNFRELFIILFWRDYSQDKRVFDFTRGIILGDKDIETYNITDSDVILNANICTLCNVNNFWIDKFGFTNSVIENEDQERINKINQTFLYKTLQGKGLKISKEELTNIDKDNSFFSSIEINYDGEFCTYDSAIDVN